MLAPVDNEEAATHAARAAAEAPAPPTPIGEALASEMVPEPAPRSVIARRYWTVVGSHAVVDIYPVFFASMVLLLTEHLGLRSWQIATVYAVSQILSGFPQGLAAWASDKYDTRLCGPIGLLLSAVCSCLIGFAADFWQLLILLSIAQIGNGMYHPIGAALSGQLGAGVLRHGRALAVSIFFAAGMLGQVIGPHLSTETAQRFGLRHLVWLAIPGVITAGILFVATRHMKHREHNHHEIHASLGRAEMRRRWGAVWALYFGNALRFIVNTAMFVLFPVWASAHIPGDTRAATALNANLIVAMTIGMGIAAIFTARIVPPGRERGAIVILAVLGSAATAVTGFAGDHVGMWAMYLAAALTALGFAAVLPLTIGLAQRLLPGRTGLASGLMMGCSWAPAAVAAPLAEVFLGARLNAAKDLPLDQINTAFVWFAGLLLLGGLLILVIPGDLIRKVANHR